MWLMSLELQEDDVMMTLIHFSSRDVKAPVQMQIASSFKMQESHSWHSVILIPVQILINRVFKNINNNKTMLNTMVLL